MSTDVYICHQCSYEAYLHEIDEMHVVERHSNLSSLRSKSCHTSMVHIFLTSSIAAETVPATAPIWTFFYFQLDPLFTYYCFEDNSIILAVTFSSSLIDKSWL